MKAKNYSGMLKIEKLQGYSRYKVTGKHYGQVISFTTFNSAIVDDYLSDREEKRNGINRHKLGYDRLMAELKKIHSMLVTEGHTR